MVHHDEELPDEFQYGSGFGPSFETQIQSSKTGHERRIQGPAQGRHQFVIQKDLQSTAEAYALKSFALGRRGAYASFLLKDWSDFSTAVDGVSAPTNLDSLLGTGDGSNRLFYLTKTYDQSGPLPYPRRIKHYVPGTLVVAIDGTPTAAYTVNGAGVITFTVAPALGEVVTAGFEFKVSGRFQSSFEQWVKLQADSYDNWTFRDIGIIETLDEEENPETFFPGGSHPWGDVASDIMLSYQDGVLQTMKPTANINAVFPHPELVASGVGHFTLAVDATAGFTVQPRDDTGAAVGSALSAGQIREFGFARTLDGLSYYWTVT